MAITALSGPLVSFGATAGNSNPDQGPSLLDEGSGLLDPRAPFTYQPGQRSGQATYGWSTVSRIPLINAVPSALATNNIAAAQVPTAATPLTLVSSTAAGITVGVSITNASTGQPVTVLAIDGAMGSVAFGQSATINIWDPTKAVSRNVRVTSSGDDTGGFLTVAGYDLYGYPMTETITLGSGLVSGKKAFKYIASATPTGTLSGSNVALGTGDVYGFPLRADFVGDVTIYWASALITASTGFLAAVTTTATATTGDVRGTYAVQSASNGTNRLQVFLTPQVSNLSTSAGLTGVTQA